MAFADKLLNDKDNTAAGKYLEFLKSGSKDYPIEILKQAGVDMSEPATVDSALKQFGTLLAELEGLV
jgi:oligoendopeptidase F